MSSTTTSTPGQKALTVGGYATLIGGGVGGSRYAVQSQKKLNAVNKELFHARTPISDQMTINRTDKYVRAHTGQAGDPYYSEMNLSKSKVAPTSKVAPARPPDYNPVGYTGVDRNAGAFRTLRKAMGHAAKYRTGISTGFREQNGRIVLVDLQRTMDRLSIAPPGIDPNRPGKLAFKPSDKSLAAVTDASGKRLRRIGGAAPFMLQADTHFTSARNRWLGVGAAVIGGYALLNAGAPRADQP